MCLICILLHILQPQICIFSLPSIPSLIYFQQQITLLLFKILHSFYTYPSKRGEMVLYLWVIFGETIHGSWPLINGFVFYIDNKCNKEDGASFWGMAYIITVRKRLIHLDLQFKIWKKYMHCILIKLRSSMVDNPSYRSVINRFKIYNISAWHKMKTLKSKWIKHT